MAYIDPGTGITLGSNLLAYILMAAAACLGVVLLCLKRIIGLVKRHPRAAVLGITIPAMAALVLFGYHYFHTATARTGGGPDAVVSDYAPGGHDDPVPAKPGKGAARGTTGNVGKTNASPKPFTGRIVILGIDGMSPVIAERMMKEGKLPHFAKLRKDGDYRRLATSNPAQSPVAWAGFATGVNPGEHGLYDFIRRDPKTYRLALSTTSFKDEKAQPVIKVRRFWDYAGDLGVESVILNCPVTFPPGRIKGRLLSGMGTPDILGTEGTFTFYTSENTVGQDTGGRVIPLPGVMTEYTLDLYGPRQRTLGGADNVKASMLVLHDPDRHTAEIELDGKRFTLKQGEWSGWQDVTFPLGARKTLKGLVQFYLVEANMDRFRLYASPINYDPREPYFPISSPDGYAKELAGKIGLFATQGMPNDTWAVNEGRLTDGPFLQRVEAITKQRRRILDLELGRTKQGILFAYFDCLDVVQHMCWRRQDIVESWYVKMDELLGQVRVRLGKDDVLIVLSDHGFASFRRTAHVNAWLRENGYLTLKDGRSTGSELLKDIDWSKTRAYAIGFGAVYLNRKGREGQGIVQPGAETAGLKQELAKKLAAWTDGGTTVVNHVYAGVTIFHGPYRDQAPDLYLGFADGYRASWQTALGAVPAAVIEDNKKPWNGDHLIDPALVPGVLFCTEKLRDHPTLYDLAPTILRAVGCPDAKLASYHLDGKPLF